MKKNAARSRRKIIIIFGWILIWQAIALWIGNDILIAGPVEVGKALLKNLGDIEFIKSAGNSFIKISTGFCLAFFSGIVIASFAHQFPIWGEILEPVIGLMKTVPVASIVILLLIWTTSENLSIAISFMVTFPAIYFQMQEGILSVDRKLLEMAQVLEIPTWKKIWYLYRPAVLPYLAGSCRAAAGMGWKSGIAAEVIGVPDHTIGERLYTAKIYLETADLFAWTIVVLILCSVFEKAVFFLLRKIGGEDRIK